MFDTDVMKQLGDGKARYYDGSVAEAVVGEVNRIEYFQENLAAYLLLIVILQVMKQVNPKLQE